MQRRNSNESITEPTTDLLMVPQLSNDLPINIVTGVDVKIHHFNQTKNSMVTHTFQD